RSTNGEPMPFAHWRVSTVGQWKFVTTCSVARATHWLRRLSARGEGGRPGSRTRSDRRIKALRRATEALREDQAVQKVLAEAERLAQDIERVAQQGKEPTKEQVEQYDKALQSVQGNPVYQQMVAAQANFEKLMTRINARIYEGIKKGAASPIITLG